MSSSISGVKCLSKPQETIFSSQSENNTKSPSRGNVFVRRLIKATLPFLIVHPRLRALGNRNCREPRVSQIIPLSSFSSKLKIFPSRTIYSWLMGIYSWKILKEDSMENSQGQPKVTLH